MEGKRFAAGLAVGILAALVVIGGSFALAPASGGSLVLDFGANPQAAGGATTTTVLSSNTVVKVGTNTSQGSAQVPSSTTTTTTVNSSTVPPTPTNSETGQSAQPSSFDFVAKVLNQPGSSQVSNLPQQPAVQTFLVIMPIVLALILGGVLYMAARKKREESAEEN